MIESWLSTTCLGTSVKKFDGFTWQLIPIDAREPRGRRFTLGNWRNGGVTSDATIARSERHITPSVERAQSVVGLVQHRTMVGSVARRVGVDDGVGLVVRLG
nr:hypothetical protein [Streptomyces sp. DSM 41633]